MKAKLFGNAKNNLLSAIIPAKKDEAETIDLQNRKKDNQINLGALIVPEEEAEY